MTVAQQTCRYRGCGRPILTVALTVVDLESGVRRGPHCPDHAPRVGRLHYLCVYPGCNRAATPDGFGCDQHDARFEQILSPVTDFVRACRADNVPRDSLGTIALNTFLGDEAAVALAQAVHYEQTGELTRPADAPGSACRAPGCTAHAPADLPGVYCPAHQFIPRISGVSPSSGDQIVVDLAAVGRYPAVTALLAFDAVVGEWFGSVPVGLDGAVYVPIRIPHQSLVDGGFLSMSMACDGPGPARACVFRGCDQPPANPHGLAPSRYCVHHVEPQMRLRYICAYPHCDQPAADGFGCPTHSHQLETLLPRVTDFVQRANSARLDLAEFARQMADTFAGDEVAAALAMSVNYEITSREVGRVAHRVNRADQAPAGSTSELGQTMTQLSAVRDESERRRVNQVGARPSEAEQRQADQAFATRVTGFAAELLRDQPADTPFFDLSYVSRPADRGAFLRPSEEQFRQEYQAEFQEERPAFDAPTQTEYDRLGRLLTEHAQAVAFREAQRVAVGDWVQACPARQTFEKIPPPSDGVNSMKVPPGQPAVYVARVTLVTLVPGGDGRHAQERVTIDGPGVGYITRPLPGTQDQPLQFPCCRAACRHSRLQSGMFCRDHSNVTMTEAIRLVELRRSALRRLYEAGAPCADLLQVELNAVELKLNDYSRAAAMAQSQVVANRRAAEVRQQRVEEEEKAQMRRLMEKYNVRPGAGGEGPVAGERNLDL